MSAVGILIELIGRDGASPALLKVAASADKTAASVGRAETGIASFSKKATAALGAVAAVDIAAHLVKDAAQFQRSMLLVQTQAGASASEVKKMSAAILDMAGSVGTAPEKLATSLYHIESVGLRGAKALNVLRIAAEGAKVGNADLEETTNALTSTVASGIGGVKNMQQAMGELNAIVGAGDMKLSDLNDALGSGLLVTMKTFGVNLTQTGAALATFGDNNIRGADAATSLIQAVRAMSAPMKGGLAALDSIGLGPKSLSKDLQSGGLTKALDDLSRHMKAAGDTGAKAGAFITEAFGKRAGTGLGVLVDQLQRYHVKLTDIQTAGQQFGSEWTATTKTAAFEFASIRSSVDAVGISIGLKLLPVVQTGMAGLIDAGHAIGAISPEIKVIGGAVGAMWLAFKGYQIVTAGAIAIRNFAVSAQASFAGALSAAKTYGVGVGGVLTGAASETSLTASIMEAEFASIAQAAQVEAATVAQAQADQAEAYAALVAASDDATANMISNSQNQALAAQAAADEAAAAAAETADAAAAAAAAVDTAGSAAGVGWAGVAGPIGLAAVGVLAVVSLFHKSASASKQATDAAKAYTDALKGGGSDGKTTLIDTISKQLSDNNLPAQLAKINASLGTTAFTGKQFISAITSGNPALATLRGRLRDVIAAGTEKTAQGRGFVYTLTPAAKAATSALKSLNVQQAALSGAAAKEIAQAKTFGVVETSIAKTTTATKLGTDAAKQYATMAGLVVDKNGVVAGSQHQVDAAVNSVASAYDKATQTGSDYLAALNTFSKSSGTASDRAALIGATLKANAGDALNFASQMNAAAVATGTFYSDVKSNAKNAKQSTDGYLSSLVNLRKGTIDYNKAGAAPLISDLQSIQTSAINAAEATYQHNIVTKGAKGAADLAVSGYQGVENSLVRQLEKLGLTSKQAQALTDKYLGVPKNVRTAIEQTGANPVVDVLNKIGKLLATLTGQRWDAKISVTADIAPSAIRAENLLNNVRGSTAFRITNKSSQPGMAVGTVGAFGQSTIPPNTRFTVGEEGWEGGVTDSQGRTSIFSHAQSKAMGFRTPIGYAQGTGVESAFARLLASLGVGRAGQAGALGNAQAESNFNTGAVNSIGATGIFQWLGGRLAGLRSLAHRMGTSPKTEKAQLAFFKQELEGPFHNVLTGLRNATSARAAATLFNRQFEISGDNSGNRENNAARIYQQLASGQIKSTGGTHAPTAASLRAMASLITRIKGTDVQRIMSNLGKTVADTKSGFASLFNDLARAGAPNALVKTLKGIEGQIVSIQTKAIAAKSKLSAMTQYRSGITSTLTGAFDPTKYGSVTDLITGLHGATGSNNAYAHDVNKLRGEAKGNKSLLGFINTLAASGQTATLHTLATGSRGQLSQVTKAVTGYNASVAAGGDAATAAKYGTSVAAQQHLVNKLVGREDKWAAIVGKLVHSMGHQKVTLKVGTREIAAEVVNSHEMDQLLAHLEHEMSKGKS